MKKEFGKWIFLSLVVMMSPAGAHEEVIKLWKGKVPFSDKPEKENVVTEKRPGAFRMTEVGDPELIVHPANEDTLNGMALIICPGGGYVHLTHLDVGEKFGKYFSEIGFTCFVLHYQVPSNREGALSDAKQAVSLVRASAEKWGFDKNKVGMVGSSAGGHLIAALSVQTEDLSARPNFSILLCPAYLCDRKTGELSPEFVEMAETPPFFLFTAEDDTNWVEGTRVFRKELTKRNLSNEVHIVPKGGHGFGLKENNPAAEVWPGLALKWIESLEL